jgi:CRP/FNR family transcriptional regulator, dissimilatory nitrate respiration regulator
MEFIEFLNRTPLFSGLDSATLDFFAKNSHRRRYGKGAEIFSAGDTADRIFFIAEGWVKLYRMTRDGEEIIIHIFAPGETFAEAAVFNPQRRYPVDAQAIEEASLLEIPRQLFVDKIRENSDIALMMLGSISARQRILVQQIEQITAKSAPQRIGIFLLRLCPPGKGSDVKVHLPYDKSLIARRLNIQPETFSRALAKLEPYGVTLHKRDITITDTVKLADFCELDERDRPC